MEIWNQLWEFLIQTTIYPEFLNSCHKRSNVAAYIFDEHFSYLLWYNHTLGCAIHNHYGHTTHYHYLLFRKPTNFFSLLYFLTLFLPYFFSSQTNTFITLSSFFNKHLNWRLELSLSLKHVKYIWKIII